MATGADIILDRTAYSGRASIIELLATGFEYLLEHIHLSRLLHR
jgi:hypothetical protein